MIRSLMLFVIIMMTVNSYAQDKKVRYASQNYVGLLDGEAKAAFQLQTIHGIEFRSWFAGVGAGLDYYYIRTVPVFFTLNKDLKIKNRTFFISGDVGPNYTWASVGPAMPWASSLSKSSFDPAIYWAAGIGYKATMKNRNDAILINLGYSYKKVEETRESAQWCINPPCNTTSEQFDYTLKRISIRLGWQF
ncbi:MAG: hypothetical protein ABW174_06275 [Flavitalea sp.]